MALGYELYYVTLIKKGLQVGESAVFDVAYNNGTDGNPEWVNYRKVLFPCRTQAQAGSNGTGVKAVVVLPAGEWKFTEDTSWSWKYKPLEPLVATINAETLAEIKVQGGTGFRYEFTNNSKGTTSPSDEGVVVNVLFK